MFCDLVGSTSLAAKLDAEDWRTLVNTYLDEASAAVTGLGGHVLKKLGDGLMALFGYPQAQENDAERAVRAALAIQRALADLNARSARSGAPELSARIGIECGSVVVDANGEVFGEAPNVAARVQAAAEPGSVLITGSVQRQVAGLFVVEEKGAHEFKGVAQPLSLYRVVRASGGGRRGGARALTSFVGREEDIGTLLRRWDRVRAGEGQFVQIVGEPGLGKSRLVEEFHSRLGETPHTWVEWNSSQLLQNTPLHPVAEWGRVRFGGQDVAAARRLADLETTLAQVKLDVQETATLLAPLLDIPLPADRAPKFGPEELRRRQLAAMVALLLAGARTQPVVLAFEDLHWADPTSLDLIQALAERGAKAPLLVVATTRPEFRAPWGMRSHHAVVALAPLDRTEVRRMVGEIAAQDALPQDVVESVNERTGGVPLFVEEVTRLLVERGEQGGVRAIPPTLQQSLAARLDRLGSAREIAQIGAVLGRDFAYSLLRNIAETTEPALQTSLERLADSDLLFVEGAPPEATYRFKHALIQDAAYDSLLKSRRQALHRRAAEVLRDSAVRAAAEPEVVAHHFTQAGLDELAIEWWGKAGDQALRRSAFQEAIAHLGKAIEMADKAAGADSPQAAGDAVAVSQRLKLQIDYGQAVMWSKGFAAEETRVAFARATELAADAGDFAARFAAAHSQWASAIVRGEQRRVRELASSFLKDAEDAGQLVEIGVARRGLAQACYLSGEFLEARTHCERALDACDPEREAATRQRFTDDTGPIAISVLAMTMWQLGEVEGARRLIDEANRRAKDVGHAPSMAHPLNWKSRLEILGGDAAAALSAAETLEGLCREHGMPYWRVKAELDSEWARGCLHDAGAGADGLRRALAAASHQGMLSDAWFYTALLAELEAKTLGPDSALEQIDEALVLARQVDDRCDLPFPYLLRGELLLERDEANPLPAEEAFGTALAIAREQGARSWGLRAALSLAKVHQSTGKFAEAHALLSDALEGRAPTPEMAEIAEAQALLAALTETDEVKAAAAQRQRRLHLQTAYGNALIAARGYGAPETAEAFSKARESAVGEEGASERLAADYGLWVGSFVRGELSAMRAHAKAFLGDVEARPDSPEAGVAHRAIGITRWFAGEYREAQDHLERALALFQPGRDDDFAFRFGWDAGVAAMHYLALTLWPMGDVGRAVSLDHDAQTRIAGLSHIGTHANGNMHAALFELMRGSLSHAALNAAELARIAREHDLPMWKAFGLVLEGAATAEGEGPRDMLRGIELLREQNILPFDGLFKIALANAEARTGEVDRALAILDEALATSERTGHGTFDAELHRARGEMLLKRDPATLAPAEEALLTAIAVSKQQSTRSFGLRAALPLARLYQSTGRPTEAHAVLAPALEGFASTPEMPEIAEAQALLAALTETDEFKAAESQRRRRLHLQTAYGQAMMWAKGFSAEETRAAFSRATELTAKTDNFTDRFTAAHFQWSFAYLRGELRSARELELSFLKEAEDAGRVVEAGVARRGLALASYLAADFLEARIHCERALEACDAESERETQERFQDATGPLVVSVLAVTMWQLGEVDRARELIEESNRRASELGNAPSMAHPLLWTSHLEILRGDPAEALIAAETLQGLGQEHGLPFWRTFAELTVGWARGRLYDAATGAEDLGRVLEGRIEQDALNDAWFYKGLLAELEAETLGAEPGLARIDEAIALARQVETRCNLPFLHLLRGELLLERDPSNPRPAEEAFQTALAIAKEQGARSWGLRAALSLAKLYQSTEPPRRRSRGPRARARRFAPTPEMPEIAEAQTLLVAIEAGAHVRRE